MLHEGLTTGQAAKYISRHPKTFEAMDGRAYFPPGALRVGGPTGCERTWTAAARLEAVITTAAMDEASRSAWCREHGVYPQQLQEWRESATQALAEPEEARASPQQTKHDRRRIKELEREGRRKDKALAETAALLILSKKVSAIFNKGEDE